MIGLTEKIMCEVGNERLRQDRKWGEQNHALAEWISILGEEFGEVCKSVNEWNWRNSLGRDLLLDIRKEAIHTAAVAVAMIECIDRKYK